MTVNPNDHLDGLLAIGSVIPFVTLARAAKRFPSPARSTPVASVSSQ